MRPFIVGLLALSTSLPALASGIDSNTFGGLRARSLGPATMSGRITAIVAHRAPGAPLTVYVGTASGGVWKSTTATTTFKPIFDQHTQSIGSLALDPKDPQTLWVGTGEANTRNSVSIGTGIYRSRDGGQSFEYMGLGKSERIARVLVDPRDSNTVYACATGPLWSAGGERGLYRSLDSGQTWQPILGSDTGAAGCADLALDPGNPQIIYAALWQKRRGPDFFTSGGPESGLYRSFDGGESFQQLTRGLPDGELGRITLATAPSRPGRLYAIVEAEQTALYRSDDIGHSFDKLTTAGGVGQRPFYFAELIVDPNDADRIYRPALTLAVSTDGGASFTGGLGSFGGRVHPDHHALWIDPADSNQMLLGTDGGVYMSLDKAASWRFIGALPVSQFYHVSVDDAWPYNVYGGLQDNGSWTAPSRVPGGIQNADWKSVGFGDGFWVYADPADNNLVYSQYQGGQYMRVNRTLGDVQRIQPTQTAGLDRLRFNWNAPIHLSPSTPGTIYVGSQYLHRSTDRGQSWQTLSPDLTTNDPKRQRQATSGGLTRDNTTAENNATIYTIAESSLEAGLIWVGTDDGRLHLTRDQGQRWTDLSQRLPGLRAGAWIHRIEASPHDPASAFVVASDHRRGDFAPYVYRTDDYGQSFTSLASEQIQGYAWVIEQDPVNPALLYLGTEFGLYISLDGGENWARFAENLPPVAVHDLVIHPTEHDLVLGTHGRGVYIIDDLTPLRALTDAVRANDVGLLPTRPAVMVVGGALQSFNGDQDYVGENPTEAAEIAYWLKKRHVFGDLKVLVYDANDELITTIPGSKRIGLNRVAWPMRLKPPKLPASTNLVPAFAGPQLLEGRYRIELVKGKERLTGTIELVPDPRSPHSAEDRQLQQQTALTLYKRLADLTYLIESIADLRKQATTAASTLDRGDGRKLRAYADKLEGFTNSLVATDAKGMFAGDEKLREDLGTLYGAIVSYGGRPTQSQLAESTRLLDQLSDAQSRGAKLADEALNFDALLQKRSLSPLRRTTREAWEAQSARAGSGSAASAPWTGVWLR